MGREFLFFTYGLNEFGGRRVSNLSRRIMIIDKAGSNNSYLFVLRRNLILRKKTVEIIKEFKDKSIDCLVLKGLYLAFSVYPDAGLRPMVDADLLVKKEDLDRITNILNALGYAEVSPRMQRVYGCDATFSNKDEACSVDIHWDLCQYERFKGVIDVTGDFWLRAVGFNLDSLPARTLSIEDHILYVSLHYGLIHLLYGLNGAYDLFYLIHSHIFDWETIINSAHKHGIETPLYYSLHKACKITGLKLPDFVLERLKPHPFRRKLIDYLLFRRKTFVLRYLCQALLVRDFSDTFKVLWRLLKGVRRQYRRSIQVTLKNESSEKVFLYNYTDSRHKTLAGPPKYCGGKNQIPQIRCSSEKSAQSF